MKTLDILYEVMEDDSAEMTWDNPSGFMLATKVCTDHLANRGTQFRFMSGYSIARETYWIMRELWDSLNS